MNKSLLVPLVAGLVLLVALASGSLFKKGDGLASVTTYEQCVAAGNPVLETNPPQCKTPSGQTFVQALPGTGTTTEPNATTSNPDPTPLNPSSYKDLIRVDSPKPGSTVTSPLAITGAARGTWYFEASFPVKLVDSSGKILAQAPAQAQGEWMTTSYVPFKARLAFTPPKKAVDGFLVFEKDNPSGLPEQADEFRVPVRIAADSPLDGGSGSGGSAQAGCYVGGCSGQICSDQKDAMSTCEYTPAYACYKESFAKCERQASGQCGWTQNKELAQCLANPAPLE